MLRTGHGELRTPLGDGITARAVSAMRSRVQGFGAGAPGEVLCGV